MATVAATGISLQIDHDRECGDLSRPLFLQLANGNYDRCSVLRMPTSAGEWRARHRTARKRADRAARLGYRFGQIERHNFSDDIHEINTSLPKRQGRPMSDAYRRHTRYEPLPDYPCLSHRVTSYGVTAGRRLVAYLWLYRAGDLALVSSILGHGAHLENAVMYLLMQGVIDAESDTGGFLVYNRHDSGEDGLRFYKERCGFAETAVEWLP